jgi:hypothetical protein
MAFDPHRQGWPCRTAGFCTGHWFWDGHIHVCVCRYCRRFISTRVEARGLDALQGLVNRESSDFPGAVE